MLKTTKEQLGLSLSASTSEYLRSLAINPSPHPTNTCFYCGCPINKNNFSEWSVAHIHGWRWRINAKSLLLSSSNMAFAHWSRVKGIVNCNAAVKDVVKFLNINSGFIGVDPTDDGRYWVGGTFTDVWFVKGQPGPNKKAIKYDLGYFNTSREAAEAFDRDVPKLLRPDSAITVVTNKELGIFDYYDYGTISNNLKEIDRDDWVKSNQATRRSKYPHTTNRIKHVSTRTVANSLPTVPFPSVPTVGAAGTTMVTASEAVTPPVAVI